MERDIIRIKDRFYILATSSRVDARTQVLKEGDTFGVFDRFGDIHTTIGQGEQGIYHTDTRFVSTLELLLEGTRPLLLSSTVKEKNDLLTVDLTNTDICRGGELCLRRGDVHIFRSKFFWKGVCYERVRIINYGNRAVSTKFGFRFDADFLDIFEVRGVKREKRGRILGREVKDERTVVISYKGRDGIIRRTIFEADPVPTSIKPGQMEFELLLEPMKVNIIYLTISLVVDDRKVEKLSYESAFTTAQDSIRRSFEGFCEVETSNTQFNSWLSRSVSDLHMLITDTEHGLYPYAGIPWYATCFGRDGIITAFESLWINPDIARGVLRYLAYTQAREFDEKRDAQPGKIVHEVRKCEMANTGEVPFGRYYGSVDATPLFIVLAKAYYDRTGDVEFIESIWENIELALRWLDEYGDVDGDGFIEYARKSSKGLINQGWKDSFDSVFHADGELAEGPIALCEVQGYAYWARLSVAALAMETGRTGLAIREEKKAYELKKRFEERFWSDELSTYVLALDGKKRACMVNASNPGHTLASGIVSQERAGILAKTLLRDELFSGWGIRTVSAMEKRYNPMSYHNGSVWPHDNAMIAYGLAKYGFKDEVIRIFHGLFEASSYMDFNRMPELFCGFTKRPEAGPTIYPVACSPQAWASATVFLMLQASLGMRFDVKSARVEFHYPQLPEFLHHVEIKNLKVGPAVIDLLLRRHPDDVGINVLRKAGDIEVVVYK